MGMKPLSCRRYLLRILLVGFLAASVSCATTYDNMGRPKQTVDSDALVAGIVVVGLLALLIAAGGDSDHDDDYHGSWCH